MTTTAKAGLGWLSIVRLGLVQASLGAMVILTTSTFNRVMVVELALAAMVPGALVTLREVLQFLRPRWGHGSDVGGRRTPWIVGGMAALALGVFGAGLSTAWMSTNLTAGLAGSVLSYIVIGIGVGAAGTNLLALLAKQVPAARRAPAATIVWLMMFVGFIIASAVAGAFLDTTPADATLEATAETASAAATDAYDPDRLVLVTGIVCAVAFLVSALAVWGVEPRRRAGPPPTTAPAADTDSPAVAPKPRFLDTLAEVWREDEARRFAIFVFVSMFAYNMQDLILEPFAGAAFGFTVGESTRLTSEQHSGALIGMILVGILASRFGKGRPSALKKWTVAGCIASGAALLGLALASLYVETWPLRLNVVLMGVATGGFTVAAISSMMGLANVGASNREGIRMGVWGAAQAIAFASGSFVGTLAADASRLILDDRAGAYGLVFTIEGVLFLVAAGLATRIGTSAAAARKADAETTAIGDEDATSAPVLSAAAEQQLGRG